MKLIVLIFIKKNERNIARSDGLADQMINKIAVIGTGVIGSGWIVRFLAHNKKVIAYDKDIRLKKF